MPFVHAKEKPYDVKEYDIAARCFETVTASTDTAVLHHFADSIYKVGVAKDNYRIKFLYYETMNLYHYYAGHSTEERLSVFDGAMEEARRVGSEKYYWGYYHIKVTNYLYESSSKSLEMAEQMRADAEKQKSVLGMMRSYFALSYIYSYRMENMMAVDEALKAVKLGEEHTDDDAVAMFLYEDVLMNLALYYTNVPDIENALVTLDKVEQFLRTTTMLDDMQKDSRMREVLSKRVTLYFGDERYDQAREALHKLEQYDGFEEHLSSFQQIDLYFAYLMLNGRENDALALIEEQTDDMKHYFKCLYYKFHGEYKKAMEEWDGQMLFRDSISYQTRLEDMAAADAKMGNFELRFDKERLQNRQRMIVMGSAAGIMLIIIGFVIVLYIRNRRHTKILMVKNEQLKVARDEAEDKRQEAEEQRAVAEEQRSIAEEQRAVAEEQRMIAEEHRAIAEEQRSIAEEHRAIAEEKKAEAEEQRAAAEVARHQAEQANEMKGHFIENMMHEIRTPLNAISGFSALLTDPMAYEDPDSMKEASDMIGKNTQHLVHLLDDIIQISNYESLSIEIEQIDTSICEALLTCVMNAPQSATGIQITPNVDNLADDPMMFTCSDMLQRAFGCLLNNAVKFTKEGSITVGADYDDQKVTFWVEDTGPGIPEGEEEHIFERFIKLDNFVPGTGLGLSLCRAIVTALNGEVKLDRSYAGPGSRFVIIVDRQLELLGTAKPKGFMMEAMPAQEGGGGLGMTEEEIRAFLAESGEEMSEEDIQAMLAGGGMFS